MRRIREERKLSLDAVEEMSLGFRERVTKSHLSRIENGRAVPTFPRIFTLSQIYGVPVTALAERFEIELLREVTPAYLTDRSDEDILTEASRLKVAGRYVELLSWVTSALESREDSASLDRQIQKLRRYYIDALIHLERYETAKAECELLLSSPDLEGEDHILTLLAFIICCYRLKRFTIAQMALDDATQKLEAMGEAPRLRADLEANRAAVSYALGRTREAAESFARAASLYHAVPDPFEACRARINLAQALIEGGESDPASSELKSALQTAEDSGYDRLQALALSHLGVLAFNKGDDVAAEGFVLRSNKIARPRDYLSLIFRNCYYLWILATRRKDETAIRGNERTLRTYLGRVDPDLPEVAAFRDHTAGGRR